MKNKKLNKALCSVMSVFLATNNLAFATNQSSAQTHSLPQKIVKKVKNFQSISTKLWTVKKRHYFFISINIYIACKCILNSYIKTRVKNLTKIRIVYIIQWSLLPGEVKCRWLKNGKKI